jgi:condensin complex subunit 1
MSILTNLIMNDMVKVKGQISEMALCIVDTEEKLAGKGVLHNIRPGIPNLF